MQAMDHEKRLRRKLNLVHFLSIQKLHQKSKEEQQYDYNQQEDASCSLNSGTDQAGVALKRILDDIGSSLYKQKLLRFSKRIDRWHDEQSKLNSGVFEEDRDFVELDHSPSKFSNLPADHSSIDDFLLGGGTQNEDSLSKSVEGKSKTKPVAESEP